jgi:hypothetical protein
MDDFVKLQETPHMFEWFADEPEAAIRASIEGMLCEQVADSRLERLIVTSEADWLTGGRRQDDDPDKMLLVRAAFAFEFALRVIDPAGTAFDLRGVFTWAIADVDRPGEAKSRQWLDIDGDLRQFGSDGELKERVYFEQWEEA